MGQLGGQGRWAGGEGEKLGTALRLTVGCCHQRAQVGEQAVRVTWTRAMGNTQAAVVEKLRPWQRDNSGRGREKTSVLVMGK